MKLIQLLKKPLNEIVFFTICFICIVPPTINYSLLLYNDFQLDILFIQYFSIAVTISYILTVIAYLFRNYKFIKVSFYIFVFALFGVFIFLKLHFGTNISPLIVTMIVETDYHESSEFLRSFLFTNKTLITILLLVSIILITIIAEHSSFLKKKKIKSIFTVIILITIPISLYSIHIAKSLFECKNMDEVNQWYDSYFPYAMDNISTLMYALYIPNITSREINTVLENTKKAVSKKAIIKEKDSLDVILVIGESYIKRHAHLYGYNLPTTPNMDEEKRKGNLYSFTDYISPYNATTLAIKNMLCTNSLADGETWSESVYFPAIFKKAGYRVYMWDNQKVFGTFLIYTFTINSLLYNKEIIDCSYSGCNDHTYQYDGEMVSDVINSKKGKTNFMILHLMGQHVKASERYPDQYRHFNYNDIRRNDPWLDKDKKQSIAEYDNATLYNDAVLAQLFDYYRDKNAVIVYLSDHGEEIYDVRDAMGRDLADKKELNIIQYQNDIPFIVWCSDQYKSLHHDIINDLERAVDRKAMSDNICHLLFRLANIETPYYVAKRDVSSHEYDYKKRLIYDKYYYDDLK